MAKVKSDIMKQMLSGARKRNSRAPIWVYMVTGDKSMVRGKGRNWRTDKLGKKIRKKLAKKVGKSIKKKFSKRMSKSSRKT
ncbi:MAG: hypothetical protein V1911_00955 [Candidatus Micrarchaeota archaeon]